MQTMRGAQHLYFAIKIPALTWVSPENSVGNEFVLRKETCIHEDAEFLCEGVES